MIDPKQIVALGYDSIAERYLEWSGRVRKGERAHFTSVLLEKLPLGSAVLDLGCGSGTPTTLQLAQHFNVTGVDISSRHIKLAHQSIPTAEFIHADMMELDFPPDSFDAVAAFYSIIHVPRGEHMKLLLSIATWLRPGGLLVATMSANSTEDGVDGNCFGVPMYWSSFDSETNKSLVEEAGLSIIRAQEETDKEFGVPVTFLWVIAQKQTQLCEDKSKIVS